MKISKLLEMFVDTSLTFFSSSVGRSQGETKVLPQGAKPVQDSLELCHPSKMDQQNSSGAERRTSFEEEREELLAG
jgi:hypothetical protein